MLTVSKTITFDAAHFLPEYDGKCRNCHGHTWKLEIFVRREDGGVDSKSRMVLDFTLLKEQLQTSIMEVYDHRLINEVVAYPTAESMVENMAGVLGPSLRGFGCQLVELRLWETPDSCCIWGCQ